MATNRELEARILSNPDDREAYAVYGDWLLEQGDPRGELVAVQLKLAAGADPELAAREAKLLADHAAMWLGPLAGKKPDDFACSWRYGFLDSVRIGAPVDEYEASDEDLPEMIRQLCALPNIALLRELVLGAMSNDDWPTSWGGSVTALAESDVPAGLRSLAIDRGGYWDISSTESGDLGVLWPKLGTLRELYLELGQIELGAIDLPELRSFEINTGGLTSENLSAIRTAKLPRLESLLLACGESGGDHGCTVQVEDFLWIFAAEGLPHLRHLALANSSLADDFAARLATSKIVRQLETLDLSRGTLGDDGAATLVAHADAFAHLKKLDLSHGFFSDGAIADLRKAFPQVVLDDLQDPDDDYRYVAISE